MRRSKAYVMLLFIMIGHHLTNAEGETDTTAPVEATTAAPATTTEGPPELKYGPEDPNITALLKDEGSRIREYPVKPRKIDSGTLGTKTQQYEAESVELPPMYIAGTYDIAEKPAVEMYKILPSLATLWQSVTTDFRLVIWPPKYCHGVYVCFVDAASYSKHVKFHVTKQLCKDKALKFYPWLHKVVMANDSQVANERVVEAYNQELNTYFESVNGTSFVVHLKKQEFVKGTEYFSDTNIEEPLAMDAMGKAQDVVLLTNSRLCHAHLAGRQPMKYVPLLRDPVYKAKTDFAPSTESNSTSDGDYPYPVSSASKPTADLLEELKKMDIKSVEALNMQFKKCSTHFESGADGVRPIYSTAPVISIIAKQMQFESNSDALKLRSFTVSVSRCSWLRLWMPYDWKNIGDYAKDFKTGQTVDFFFDQAFMITPQSGGGIPLPGNSEVVKLVKFEFLNILQATMKMSYGYTGKDFSYREYIKLEGPSPEPTSTTEAKGYHSKFTVFMIRSEYCDAEIVSDKVKTKDVFDDTYKTLHLNMMDLSGECTYGTITEKKPQQ